MMHYATGRYTCRRSFLLEALGGGPNQSIACPTCDICDGCAVTTGEASHALMGLVARHRRRLTRLELAIFAQGKSIHKIGPHFGKMYTWQSDEINEAIGTAISIGLLHTVDKWPWKGRLIPGFKP